MLGQSTRKKLENNEWGEYIQKDSNPSQTWHRIRIQANRAINDLITLATKLPDEKQDEVFTYDNVELLFRNILAGSSKLNLRKAKLAELFVRHGIIYFIFEYNKIQSNETLREPVKKELQDAMILCSAIASEIEIKSKEIALPHKCPECGKAIKS